MSADEQGARTVRIENEIRLAASPERVFRALTTEQAEWYPHTYGGERVRSIVFEERVGGQVYEDWGEGLGMLYGLVWFYDPPRTVCTRGYLRNGVVLEQWATCEPDGDSTVLRHRTVTHGAISDEDAQGIRAHGDLALFEDRLRAHVERPGG